MKDNFLYVVPRGFLQHLLMAVCASLFITPTFAEQPEVIIDTGLGIIITPCTKKAKPLDGGMRYGTLKKNKRRGTYIGPNILCDTGGRLSPDSRFAVTGKVKSIVGFPWYQLVLLDRGEKRVWLPTKHVVLGEKYTPKPKYTTEALRNTVVYAKQPHSVRSCPSVDCDRVSTLKPEKRYHASKKASNGWYYVSFATGKNGWTSGKGLTVESVKTNSDKTIKAIPAITTAPVIKAPEACSVTLQFSDSNTKSLWRVRNPFRLRPAPHINCPPSLKLSADQALISFGQQHGFYKLAYVKNGVLQYGYLRSVDYKDRYDFIGRLPGSFKASESTQTILNQQAYWDSWAYQWDQFTDAISTFYARNTGLIWLLATALLLGILYYNPRTRWIVVLLFETIRDFFLKRKIEDIASHWNVMVEGLELTPTEFYATLEKALAEKQIPNSHELTINWRESGWFSPRRLYYRVTRKKIAADICCAPFGNGTFFSSWVGSFPSGILGFLYALPVLSWLAYGYERFLKPQTYYHIDTMMMFNTLVHSALIESVDHHTNEKGLKPIGGDDRKPKMKDFLSNQTAT